MLVIFKRTLTGVLLASFSSVILAFGGTQYTCYPGSDNDPEMTASCYKQEKSDLPAIWTSDFRHELVDQAGETVWDAAISAAGSWGEGLGEQIAQVAATAVLGYFGVSPSILGTLGLGAEKGDPMQEWSKLIIDELHLTEERLITHLDQSCIEHVRAMSDGTFDLFNTYMGKEFNTRLNSVEELKQYFRDVEYQRSDFDSSSVITTCFADKRVEYFDWYMSITKLQITMAMELVDFENQGESAEIIQAQVNNYMNNILNGYGSVDNLLINLMAGSDQLDDRDNAINTFNDSLFGPLTRPNNECHSGGHFYDGAKDGLTANQKNVYLGNADDYANRGWFDDALYVYGLVRNEDFIGPVPAEIIENWVPIFTTRNLLTSSFGPARCLNKYQYSYNGESIIHVKSYAVQEVNGDLTMDNHIWYQDSSGFVSKDINELVGRHKLFSYIRLIDQIYTPFQEVLDNWWNTMGEVRPINKFDRELIKHVGAQGMDYDGLSIADEIKSGTDSTLLDTDGDGFDDGYESNTGGLDPLTPNVASDILPYTQYNDFSGKISIKIFTRYSTSIQQQFTDFKVDVSSDYIAIGGGVIGSNLGNGNNLIASYPSSDLNSWMVSTHDHKWIHYAPITGYAIGMKIEGLTSTELKQYITVSETVSGWGGQADVTASVPSGYVQVGGGARIEWNGWGNLLVANYPVNSNSQWRVRSTDHVHVSHTYTHAYSIGIQDFIPGIGQVVANIKSATSSRAQHPIVTTTVADGYALTGCGAEVTPSGGVGNHMWKIEPKFSGAAKECVVSSKDQGYVDATTVSGYATGIKIM